MKELSIEEKAKRYDEAIEEAIKIIKYYKEHHRCDEVSIEDLECIFPELVESEDERIRKALIQGFNECLVSSSYPKNAQKYWHGIAIEDIFAWLEKQGEQPSHSCQDITALGRCAIKKQGDASMEVICTREAEVGNGNIKALVTEKIPIDNVEPKFNVGDKIRRKTPSSCDKDMQVARIEKDYYICNHIGKFSSEVVPFSEESRYELVEQKSTDKDEPKFKNGQWIVWQDKCYEVNYNGCGYELVDQNGLSILLDYGTIDENAHLWNITDAKDGDVLVHSSFMFGDFIFVYNNTSILQAYCYYSGEKDRFIVKDRGHHCPWDMQEVTPATNEQRELLFKKMKEAGYIWDAEKKEPKKVKKTDYEPDALIEDSYQQQADDLIDMVTEKSAWSEDDEDVINHLLAICAGAKRYRQFAGCSQEDIVKYQTWLKSLKQRCTWKPSDEQMVALEHFVRSIGESGYASPYDNNTKLLYSLLNDLKKLKG